MQFNTYLYILVFLPASVAGWFLINQFSAKAARIFLIAASLFFCGYGDFGNLKWLLASIVVNYLFVFLLQKAEQRVGSGNGEEVPARINTRKCLLWIGIAANLALLFYFKYLNFTLSVLGEIAGKPYSPRDILLPAGISFYTFQQISYLADTLHGKTKDNSIVDYLLYVTFFPKILMGPIVKQENLIPQLKDPATGKWRAENLAKGIQIFNFGLFKKVILADTFARAVSWKAGLADPAAATSMDLLLAMFAYTFQIYFDFSGYSDMAAGSALMMNVHFPVNFDSPYKAYSIRDFWRRWHVSLTRFLTEYIYIPLGGNRKGKIRTIANTMAVFLISGIWHGANWTFIFWGLLHGFFSVLDRFTGKIREKVHPALQWGSYVSYCQLFVAFVSVGQHYRMAGGCEPDSVFPEYGGQ